MSRDALVVGLNHYQCLPGLQAPAHDAEAIAQRLGHDGEFRVQRGPEIILEGQPTVGQQGMTLRELEAALVKLFKPSGANVPETALFYFSGHGIQKDAGISEGFLATSDTDPERGMYGLSLFWLRRLLQQSPVRKRVIWLDCCHSGAFLDFLEADPGSKPGTSRFFMAASREYEQAYESLEGNYSVFTEALLEGLDPERVDERAITNYALTDWVSTQLKGELQQPLFENSGSEIVLTRTSLEDPTLTAAPSDQMATLDEAAVEAGMAFGHEPDGELLADESLDTDEDFELLEDPLVEETAETLAVESETEAPVKSATAQPAAKAVDDLSQSLLQRQPSRAKAAAQSGTVKAGTAKAGAAKKSAPSRARTATKKKISAARRAAVKRSAKAVQAQEKSGADVDRKDICPYPGLQAFEASDARYFTGREELIQQLLSSLHNHNLVSVVGAASSGKTSLLQAGLIPALAKRTKGGGDRWKTKIFRPLNNPILDLAAAFIDADASDWERSEQLRRNGQLIASDERGLLRLVQANCHHLPGTDYDPREPRLLLVIDQFERLLRHKPNGEGNQEAARVCQHVIDSLIVLLQEESALVHVVLAVRSDFWEECYRRTEQLQQGPSQLIPVEPLPQEALKAAILKPALRLGWQCEIHLADMLMEDVASSPARLALLQLALRSVWLRQVATADGDEADRVMRLGTYAEMGRIRGLLVSQATDLLKELSETDQSFVQRIFLALTQLGEGSPDGLRRISKSELGNSRGPQSEALAGVLETLIESRLVVSSGNRITLPPEEEAEFSLPFMGKSNDWVEASHETLVRDWPDLRGWLAKQRDRLTKQRRIERQTEDWCEGDALFGNEAWLQGERLSEAEAYLKDHPDDLSSLAQHFIRLSQDQEVKGHQGKRKGRLVQIGIATALTAALFALMYQMFQQRNPQKRLAPVGANQEHRIANQGLRGFNLSPQALYDRIARSHRSKHRSPNNPQRDLGDPMTSLLLGQLDLTPDQLEHHGAEEYGFEADLMSDRRLLNQSLPQLQSLAKVEGTDSLHGLTLSRDGKQLAGLDPQGQINLWSLDPVLQGDKNIRNVSTAESGTSFMAQRPQLRRLAWPSPPEVDQTQASELLATLVEEGVTSISAKGIAMGETYRRLSMGEPAPGVDRRSPADRIKAPVVEQVSLSADGQALASRAAGQTAVTVWATGSGRMHHHITSIPEPVSHVQYSPGDARRLATAAGDTVYLWQMGDVPRVTHRLEHPADVTIERMEYSQDGRLVLTGGSDRQLRLWDAYSGELQHELGTSAPVVATLMGPSRIAILGSDNTIQVWDQSSGEQISRLKLPSVIAAQPEFRASEMAFSPAEDQLVVVQGQQGWNWSLASGKLQSRFKVFAQTEALSADLFEPNDPLEARLLNQARPRPRRKKANPSLQIFAKPTLRFSNDGSMLLSTRQRDIDGETVLDAQLLNLHDGSVSDVLRDEASAVIEAQFSADGKLLVTANQDGTMTFWDTQSAKVAQPVDYKTKAKAQEIPPAPQRSHATITVAHRPNNAVDTTGSIQSMAQAQAVQVAMDSPEKVAGLLRRSPKADLSRRPRQSLHLLPSDQGSLTFLVVDEAGQLQRWDSESGQGIDLAPLMGPVAERVIGAPAAGVVPTSNGLSSAITASDSSEDQLTVATATAEGQVILWELNPKTGSPRGRRLAAIPAKKGVKPAKAEAAQRISHLRLSADGETLLGLDGAHRLHLWDTSTGDRMIWPQHLMDIRLVQISDDGQRILTVDGQGTITLWDRNSGKPVQALGLPGLTAANLSADGKMMAIALPEGTIKLIDSGTGAVQTTLRGHRSAVRDVAFNPAGDRLLSGSTSGSVRLWDLDSGENTRTLQPAVEGAGNKGFGSKGAKQSAHAVHQVTFGDNGNYIAAADAQGIVRFWASDRESYARIARDRSSHQLELDRCLAAVSTAGCPVPPLSIESQPSESTAPSSPLEPFLEPSESSSPLGDSLSQEPLNFDLAPASATPVEQVQASTEPLVAAIVEGSSGVQAAVMEQAAPAVAKAKQAATETLESVAADVSERVAAPVEKFKDRLPRNPNPFLPKRKASSAAVAVKPEAQPVAQPTAKKAAAKSKPALIPDPWGTLEAFTDVLSSKR